MAGMSVSDALKQYGYVGTLANSVPELKRQLLASAARGDTPEEFTRAVQDTKWWKNNADSFKQYQILKSTQPGEFKAQRDQMVEKVRLLAHQMGVSVGEGKGSFLGYLTDMAMQHGWDDATLQAQIGHHLQGARTTFGGQAGTIQQQIYKMYQDYGQPASSYTVNLQTRAVLEGASSTQAVQAQLIKLAKSKYAAFASELDAGQTVRDIADPYLQQYAQTLELNPAAVKLDDPLIQRALTAKDATGKPVSTPIWQFQDQLRQDPRYDHTTQAVNNTYAALNQIGKDWGFSS
jgi:hypothetical protein